MNRPVCCVALAATVWLCQTGRAEVLSPYYIFAGTNGGGMGHLVQGTGVARAWQTYNYGLPVAVADTVRLYNVGPQFAGTGGTSPGREYTLAGIATGTEYPWANGPQGQLLDGATDGRTRNFASEYSNTIPANNGVWSFTRAWQGPVRMFSTTQRVTGVTYDASLESLWIVLEDGDVQRVADNGTVLSSFSPGPGRFGALAWEPASDTLWVCRNNFGSTEAELRQFSKAGQLLQVVNVSGVAPNIWGGEFAVPAPGAGALVGLGALKVVRRRRRGV